MLYPTASGAMIPGAFALAAATSQIANGFSILFAGPRGTTPLGCGLVSVFGNEVLLDVLTAPIELQTTTIGAGVGTFTVPIPNNAALVGVEVGLQALDVDASLTMIDPSTGLVVVLG